MAHFHEQNNAVSNDCISGALSSVRQRDSTLWLRHILFSNPLVGPMGFFGTGLDLRGDMVCSKFISLKLGATSIDLSQARRPRTCDGRWGSYSAHQVQLPFVVVSLYTIKMKQAHTKLPRVGT
jgi:hypothetical protein